eukprot:233710-Prorocentrum_lima.AAC.1
MSVLKVCLTHECSQIIIRDSPAARWPANSWRPSDFERELERFANVYVSNERRFTYVDDFST